MTTDYGRLSGSRASTEPASGFRPSGFDPERIEWRTKTELYANGKDLFVSGIRVGSASYDGVSSGTVPDRYIIETKLPGLRPKVARFATGGEAMKALERFTLAWFAQMLPAIAMETRRAETGNTDSVAKP